MKFVSRRLRKMLRATRFWQEHALILREFQYFPWVAIAAIACALGSAAFEGFGFGFLLAFLQSLINPTAEPFKTGIDWFDVLILGIDQSGTERLYRVSVLI